jgi:hypothetical protein
MADGGALSMSLVVGLVILAIIAFQWLTQTVCFRIGWFWHLSFHRDEWLGFYWSVMALELGVSLLFIVLFFVK